MRTVVVLGDGAEWIWTHARHFLGLAGVEVVEIVDLYHAYEHLWAVGAAVFGVGTAAAAAWVAPLKERLYQAGVVPVLAALAALTPPADAEDGGAAVTTAPEPPETAATPPETVVAEVVRKAIGYFTAHAARMDYPRFVARQFPIGSGAIESACKTLVEQRGKQAGMRWSPAGLQAVLSLRTLHRSGEWTAFWQTHPQRRRPPVGARPAAPAAPATPPPRPAAAADPHLTRLPAGRHDAPPPTLPPPRPLPPPAPRRPASDHPWRRPLARSA